ncbi:cyclodeaminase/cyclohydrolase family protein [Anaerococcus urinomassiliensis]|uniref:cyclodeaminase/cyclohydrolase family protein n=1 Tax=Anaerococcus urinomassiliensis TaxID=1745712 RepID=UPI00093BB3B1|nr:cyclodeaminase/cyclohydrolase family protein [Anaerococcus urinomassiliensis]
MTNSLTDMDIPTLLKQTRAKGANPGGGAILILISNLAINLILMMDKNDWGDKQKLADVSRETILKISDGLSISMQDDVDNFDLLMKAYKNGSINDQHYIDASKPLLDMIDINLEAMEVLGFYLRYGKKTTLTDGQIANDLLKTASLAALPTIKLNLGQFRDEEFIKEKIEKLYQKNKLLIERRNK